MRWAGLLNWMGRNGQGEAFVIPLQMILSSLPPEIREERVGLKSYFL